MASHADDPQRQAHAILGKIWYLMPQGRTDSAIKELQEATRLLAGRGSRADEIIIYGVLALAYLRRQDEEQAQLAAHRAASLIAQSRPTAAYTLEGYAGVTEVYLNLWMAGDHATARPAQQARAALRRLARTFPTAQPRAWLYEGLSAYHLGRKRHAVAAWTKSLKQPSDSRCPTNRDAPTTNSDDTSRQTIRTRRGDSDLTPEPLRQRGWWRHRPVRRWPQFL